MSQITMFLKDSINKSKKPMVCEYIENECYTLIENTTLLEPHQYINEGSELVSMAFDVVRRAAEMKNCRVADFFSSPQSIRTFKGRAYKNIVQSIKHILQYIEFLRDNRILVTVFLKNSLRTSDDEIRILSAKERIELVYIASDIEGIHTQTPTAYVKNVGTLQHVLNARNTFKKREGSKVVNEYFHQDRFTLLEKGGFKPEDYLTSNVELVSDAITVLRKVTEAQNIVFADIFKTGIEISRTLSDPDKKNTCIAMSIVTAYLQFLEDTGKLKVVMMTEETRNQS